MTASNVRPIRARSRKPAPMRSHEDIYDLVQQADKAARDAVHRTDMLTEVAQRVEKKLDDALRAIGKEGEDERGEKVGTGIVGRLMRLETSVGKRFALYDGWVKVVIGFTAAAAILLPAIWWLVSGHLEKVLK